METGHSLLRGGCSCGRNSYAISIPNGATSEAEVIFSGNHEHRLAQGVPLTTWLRIPLTWFRSQTHSYFADETHAMIRRTFSPLHAPHTKRNFCGFCGSPLTFWTDEPASEADFMSVTLGSLSGDDLRLLEDLQILPTDEEFEEHQTSNTSTATAGGMALPSSSSNTESTVLMPSTTSPSSANQVTYHSGTLAGVPWFEEMIEGSRLGRIMRSRRGMGASEDGSMAFEWEISEWQDSDTGRQPSEFSNITSTSSGKRKAEDMFGDIEVGR